MKKIFSILFALVLVVSLGLVTATPVLADVIDVPGDYSTIQDAIDAASSGDTIMVAAGEYDAFQVIEKTDISIIGAQGATVTNAEVFKDGWFMAVVLDSENINIEGVDFNGTEAGGEEVDIGIAYFDSIGRIADLTLQNFIDTDSMGVGIIGDVGSSVVDLSGVTVENSDLGVVIVDAEANLDGCTITETGVSIMIGWPFGGFDPSTVTIQGCNISKNDGAAIGVCDDSTVEAHFNNIVGNSYGMLNEGGETVDAIYNWWGDASGPYHETLNPNGTGDEVSDNVDFEPWLRAQSVTQTVEDDTVDAIDEADTQVVVTGTATVTVAQYDENPGGGPPVASPDQPDWEPLGKYIDVYSPDTKEANEVVTKLYYTDDEAKDFDEESLRLFWWDGNAWVQCSDSGVNTESNYMWAKIRASTIPSLIDLQGTPFGGYGHPPSIYVPGDYPTIQEAIDASSDGHTIIVAAGLYRENVVINKSLTLKGAQAGVDARTRSGDETFIVSDLVETGISIVTAEGRVVVIDGLTVQNAGHGITTPEPVMAADITVRNVRVLNPIQFGISITFTARATVEYCYVEGAEIAINAGAVEPFHQTVATFRNNEVVKSRFGITGYLGDSLIEGNLISDFSNGGVGISCQCFNTEIRNNNVTGYVDGTAMTFEKSHHDRPISENVKVAGNKFTGNRRGIYVWPDQTELKGITVNFNNIAGNSQYGVQNDGGETLDATKNWWGDASGPDHWDINPDGEGDRVSDSVDFEPWLGAPLVTVKTETVTDDTIDAKGEADTEVAITGTATITVAQYADNPGGDAPRCFTSLDKYIDIYVPNADDVTKLGIRVYYADAKVAAVGVSEESLRLFSWNGTAWVQCSDSGVNTTSTNGYSGYIWAEIRGDTTPTLAQLTGTPFGGYGLRSLDLFIATAELPDGEEGEAYEAGLEACVGAGNYTWAIMDGGLPDGLALATDTGTISGTPTRAGVFDFTVTVTDAAQITATAELSITITQKDKCFFATAAYGTDTAEEIDILREFRDKVLLPNSLGARFVSLYYRTSPPIADLISRHEVLKTAVRVGFVDPIVRILNWSHDLWL